MINPINDNENIAHLAEYIQERREKQEEVKES